MSNTETRTPGQSSVCFRCAARRFDSNTGSGICEEGLVSLRNLQFRRPYHCPVPAQIQPDGLSTIAQLHALIRQRGG